MLMGHVLWIRTGAQGFLLLINIQKVNLQIHKTIPFLCWLWLDALSLIWPTVSHWQVAPYCWNCKGKLEIGVEDYFLILDIEQLNRGPDTGDWSQWLPLIIRYWTIEERARDRKMENSIKNGN